MTTKRSYYLRFEFFCEFGMFDAGRSHKLNSRIQFFQLQTDLRRKTLNTCQLLSQKSRINDGVWLSCDIVAKILDTSVENA